MDKKHIGMVGKVIKLEFKKMFVDVEVLDVREIFGRVEYRVTPCKGSGSAWVKVAA